MKLKFMLPMLAGAVLIAAPTMADENASGNELIQTESVFLGDGPFSHAAGAGNVDNSTATAAFTGGFGATHLGFSGTLTSVQSATWGNEADIIVENTTNFPFPSYTWQNPGPGSAFTSFDYNSTIRFEDAGGNPITQDPNGTWNIEFIDTFDDGAGTDSESTNVTMFFEERTPVVDSDGDFSLGSISGGQMVSSNGEFALSNLLDTYSITLEEDGLFSFFTSPNDGFTGNLLDSEIGIYDSAGALIANDDDGGEGLYSAIFDLNLTAGDYTIIVGGWDTIFPDNLADGVTAGASTGDYTLTAMLIPEPSAFGVLALCGLGLVTRRRRG